jgi:hypothetical protein
VGSIPIHPRHFALLREWAVMDGILIPATALSRAGGAGMGSAF